jgi:hypothetical protein
MPNFFFSGLIRKLLLGFSITFFIFSIFFQLKFINHDWIHPSKLQNYELTPEKEMFNKNLEFLNSMNKLEEYFLGTINKNKLNDIESVIFADQLLRERFFHQNTNIALHDNWFLYVFNFFSSNRNNSLYLSSLSPDYILKSNSAICNQQAIIFQSLMKTIGMEYQSVLFNIPRHPIAFGHFASAVNVNNQWLYIDTNLEPDYEIGDPTVLQGLLNGNKDVFNKLYPTHTVKNIPEGSVMISSKNKNPAFWGGLFQDICFFISHYAWIVLLLIYFVSRKVEERRA